jgi:hypothetical protein
MHSSTFHHDNPATTMPIPPCMRDGALSRYESRRTASLLFLGSMFSRNSILHSSKQEKCCANMKATTSGATMQDRDVKTSLACCFMFFSNFVLSGFCKNTDENQNNLFCAHLPACDAPEFHGMRSHRRDFHVAHEENAFMPHEKNSSKNLKEKEIMFLTSIGCAMRIIYFT